MKKRKWKKQSKNGSVTLGDVHALCLNYAAQDETSGKMLLNVKSVVMCT